MKYTYDDLNVERIRKRKRTNRRKQEKIRRLKLVGIFTLAIIIVIILLCIIVGGDDEGNIGIGQASSDYMDANATESKQNEQISSDEADTDEEDTTPEETTPEETTPEETTLPERYASYGDDLYNDGQFVVCIDPGHGSNDVGCIGIDGTYEKDDALDLAKQLKYQLEQLGITVVMTRTTDVWVDLTDRPAFANDNKADLLISLHRNSYPADESVRGFETWINSYDSDNSQEVAQMIMSQLEIVGISKNRGVKLGTMDNTVDYRVNSDSSMPSVLLEMGFMSSPTDNKLYKDKMNDFAKAIAEAVNEWYKDKAY